MLPGAFSSAGRALPLQGRGRRFESVNAHNSYERVDEALSVAMDPAGVLDGESPRLLDEWQLAPGIWNPMRRACDARGLKGQFILTGSANPPDDITRHSSAGRIIRVRMRPMSLVESGESDARTSLGDILEGGPCGAPDQAHSLEHVLALACRADGPSTSAPSSIERVTQPGPICPRSPGPMYRGWTASSGTLSRCTACWSR